LKLAVFTDYDGTITREDTVDLILDEFGADDWRETSHRLDGAGASNIERMTAEFEGLAAGRDDVRELVRREVHIDEGFRSLADLCRRRGWPLVVLSQGVAESVETVFEKYDLEGIEWHANALSGGDGAPRIVFPEKDDLPEELGCGGCGVCKSGHIRRAAAEGRTTVYIGDGITDRCPAGVADVVVARDYLRRYLCERGAEFTPFERLDEVREALERLFPEEAEYDAGRAS